MTATEQPRDERGRRQAERTIRYWSETISRLDEPATVAALDLGAIDTEDWAHRFVVGIGSAIEDTALLIYGAAFARLLDLPPKPVRARALCRVLPKPVAEIFLRGCHDAVAPNAPVQVEGEIERDDGQRELFRAAFIPVGVADRAPVRFAFGAFNSRRV